MYLCTDYILLMGAIKISASDSACLFISPVQHLVHRIKVDRDCVLETAKWQHKISVVRRVQRYSIDFVTLDN